MSTKKDYTLEDLIEKASVYIPEEDNLEKIRKAYKFAELSHKGQYRKSGEPYIIHPLNTAIILTTVYADTDTIIAGLLHDTIEDCEVTKEELEDLFGKTVSNLVYGVSKLGRINFSTENEYLTNYYKKIIVGMSEDVRVIIVKLADRLHNMRTLYALAPEKQKKIAKETLEILAPIAHHLGIHKIKSELEDLSLRYLKPDVFYDIAERLDKTKLERDNTVNEMMNLVTELLNEHNIPHEIKGRAKSIYSIYNKLNKGKKFSDIYDLLALRILVSTEQECYLALGIIHSKFKPIPKRFKDYIAMPKSNMYQSLHTTLIGPEGQPFEIQIRTFEMHRTAEYGIAAHWKYKENITGTVMQKEEEKLSWLRQILEWQRDTSDNKEFMNFVKTDLDLFAEQVYCFTPAGDVKNLPSGSTPIDFAYAIHTAVGNKMVGARINGRQVPIDTKLNNGDRVEIITSQNSAGPSRDWLNIVKSAQAKTKINQWFKNELKEDNVMKGRDMFLTYCKTKNINTTDLLTPEYEASVMHKYGFQDWDSVLAAIGHGALKEGQVINRMQELYARDHKKQITDEELLANIQENSQSKPVHIKSKSGIVVKGIHDVAVRFSRCCAPVPGDEIVGFVTRGRGVSIHRTDCVNIINLPEMDRVRLIEAEWQPEDTKSAEKYLAEIIIYAHNRSGLLADISKTFTEKNIDIQSMNTRTSKQGIATMVVTFEIGGRNELTAMIDKLRMIENVIDIERTTG